MTDEPKTRGRPKDPLLSHCRAMFPAESQRTVERFARSLRLLDRSATPTEVQQRLVRECTRPNGSFNFSEFERRAEAAAMKVAS